MKKLYRVIARRTSYEEIYIEAESVSEATDLAIAEDYGWHILPEIYWDIEEVTMQCEPKHSHAKA